MEIKTCFIDMDGVLVDFVSAACKAHNRPNPYDDKVNYGVFEMDKIWGMIQQEFWEPLNDPGFWELMDKLPDADNIIEWACRAFSTQRVAILTAPSLGLRCVNEKRNWVRRNYPQLVDQIIFTGAKQFLAHNTALLIDDRDKNVDDFQCAGGVALLYPRLWNRGWRVAGRSFDFISELVTLTFERIS